MPSYTAEQQYQSEEGGFGLGDIITWQVASQVSRRWGSESLRSGIPSRGIDLKSRALKVKPEEFFKYRTNIVGKHNISKISGRPWAVNRGMAISGMPGTTAGFSPYMAGRGHRQMAAALRLAERKGYGVTSAAAWRAAGKAGIHKQFLKVAAGKVAKLGYTALMAGWKVELASQMVTGSIGMLRSIGRSERSMDFGTPFMATQGAYTERQRALQAITSSRMSTRAAIGGEAALLHR